MFSCSLVFFFGDRGVLIGDELDWESLGEFSELCFPPGQSLIEDADVVEDGAHQAETPDSSRGKELRAHSLAQDRLDLLGDAFELLLFIFFLLDFLLVFAGRVVAGDFDNIGLLLLFCAFFIFIRALDGDGVGRALLDFIRGLDEVNQVLDLNLALANARDVHPQ